MIVVMREKLLEPSEPLSVLKSMRESWTQRHHITSCYITAIMFTA